MKTEGKKDVRRSISKKKRPLAVRVLNCIAATMIISCTLVLVAAGVLYICVRAQINFTNDDLLFESAGYGKTTKIFVDGDSDGSRASGIAADVLTQDYEPLELEEERLYGEENSIWTPLSEMPPYLSWAFVSIEDRRFYEHDGVDWRRTAKAAANYLLHFDSRFGGSTITQQLVKNVTKDSGVSVMRKVREIVRATELERKYTKDEILELYMNIVPMSHNCIGVGAAAEAYFGKTVDRLSLAECASLAAITNSPTKYDPVNRYENNTARRNLILAKMKEYGYISEKDYDDACKEVLNIVYDPSKQYAKINSWYTDTVVEDVISDLEKKKGMSHSAASKLVYSGGLRIYTCMDRKVQAVLEEYFSDTGKAAFNNKFDPEYAMVILDPSSGDLLGVVGAHGKKSGNRMLNFATMTLRPPGSALKPVAIYAPALEEGLINYATVFDDVPVEFKKNSKGNYYMWPQNANRVYGGLTSVAEAVQYSKNTVAVRIYNLLGAERVYSYAAMKLGINTIVRTRSTDNGIFTDLAAAPLALGQLTDGVTLRDLTDAYSALANKGVYSNCRSYTLVTDGAGNVLLDNSPETRRVFSEQTACIMTKLLERVVSSGTAKDIKLKYSVDTAGKTGTSGDNKDKWFIGYTPYYLGGIWCGTKEGDPLTSMPSYHLTVWDEVMKKIHRECLTSQGEPENFEIAPGVIKARFCRDSGMLLSENCKLDPRGDRVDTGYFTADNMPKSECSKHIPVKYDKVTGGIAKDDCPEENIIKIALVLAERKFPRQIFVTDAQYTLRGEGDPIGKKGAYYTGISRTSDGHQYNDFCAGHENDYEDYEDYGDYGDYGQDGEFLPEENALPPGDDVRYPLKEKEKNRQERRKGISDEDTEYED